MKNFIRRILFFYLAKIFCHAQQYGKVLIQSPFHCQPQPICPPIPTQYPSQNLDDCNCNSYCNCNNNIYLNNSLKKPKIEKTKTPINLILPPNAQEKLPSIADYTDIDGMDGSNINLKNILKIEKKSVKSTKNLKSHKIQKRALDGPENVNPKSNIDLKCNSERLRSVILGSNGEDTKAIKRNIQKLAEERLHARYNVICAENDFSYITNTEEYCQDIVQGRTCYVFRQFNSSARKQRLKRRKFHKH